MMRLSATDGSARLGGCAGRRRSSAGPPQAPAERGVREGRAPGRVRLVRRAARLREVAGRPLRRAVRASAAGPSLREQPLRRRGARVDGEGRGGGARSRASTTRARTCRRRASTSPTSSRRTARRSSRSRTASSTPSTSAARKPRLLDTLPLDGGLRAHELLLYGDRLLVLSRGGYWAEPLPAMARTHDRRTPRRSRCSPRSTSPIRSALRVVRTLTLDGSYVARAHGRRHRRGSSPRRRSRRRCRSCSRRARRRTRSPRRRRATARCVASSRVASWLPSYRIKRAGPRRVEAALARAVPPRPPARRRSRASGC